ncbi:Transmembrane amino acid transporter family protein [Raphanus sativus]|uniref:Amino acid transporter AVT1J isoform X1 n=1 Tax=Raphanus sativus TaxID=3726 RepID=A0A6J0MAR2_RAPSA|nr:amino acid transporter AVT1J isoform X1 [Raphanus sativus]KAJ4912088.1 Transmembrane amino acid transporter family protein [Raphanus sativus]
MMNEKEDIMSEPFIVKTINDEEATPRDYEFNHNNPQGNTSFSKTCFHGINALSGVGILSVPYALASGGWLSLIILFTIAITTFYCAILIKRCMDMDPLLRTYPDIGYKAFGNTGRVIVSIFMNLELYLVATSFLILEGDNLNKLFSNVGFKFMDIEFGGKQMFIVLVALIILPSVWLDDMRILSYVSASGVFASGLILASIFWVGAFDVVGFKNQDSKMLRIDGVTTSVSLYMFCYCAHPVFPTLYTSMKNKHQFSNVMVICFTICTFIYASVAILGYLMYGSNVESQITLNLPTDKLSSKVAICTTLVNPIAKFALMVTPIIDAMRSRFVRNKKAGGLVLGTILVASNVIVALLIPFFGELMSLVGAFLSATASVILPCLCYLKISGKYRRLGLETLVLIGIVLIGIMVMITGTYKAVKDIFGRF